MVGGLSAIQPAIDGVMAGQDFCNGAIVAIPIADSRRRVQATATGWVGRSYGATVAGLLAALN